MRYDTDHKARTRVRILDEAARAIRAVGPQGISVGSLMKKAGLTHGGFYAHFESKDDLVAEAISHMFGGPYANFAALTEGKPPAEALTAYVDFYLSARHRDGRDRGCPLPALSGDLARMPASARARLGDGVERLHSAVADLLKAMGRDDPDTLAASAIAEMVGAIALARATHDGARSDEILAATRGAVKKRLGI
jgi:TetR/AcrR family transcriptional regulator, transcriptional repressor for nem operon